MSDGELIIDLSQFIAWPARSGIQRVLVELIRQWPSSILPVHVAYRNDDHYEIVSLEGAQSILQGYFDGSNAGIEQSSSDLRAQFDNNSIARIPTGNLAGAYSAYLLPELTYHHEILDVLRQWGRDHPQRTFAIFYDALPQTNPEVFAGSHQMITSRYFREIAHIDNVACISKASLDCLAGRLRRRPVPNPLILSLGTDPFPISSAECATTTTEFVVIGSVEPRKNHSVVFEAFNALWRNGFDGRLHFIGSRGSHSSQFHKELSDRAISDPMRFRWTEKASNSEIRDALKAATGAIFISQAEGYGLPAVEALAMGCPLIASVSLPALENLRNSARFGSRKCRLNPSSQPSNNWPSGSRTCASDRSLTSSGFLPGKNAHTNLLNGSEHR